MRGEKLLELGRPPVVKYLITEGQPMTADTADTVDTTKLWDLIKDIKFAMFTARHGDGQLHSRPMTTQNGRGERGGVLWFFMSRSGEPVADLEEHPEVNVTYSDPGKDSYVSISGAARVVEDLGRKKAMWNTPAEAWFPGGPSDPDLALVAVLVAEAEYWDMKSNKAVQLFKMAKAAVSGEPPKDLVEHRRVRL